ncbi:MAG: hypothetical protein H0Z34_13325 [Brevibacillus sp.]|nr:hypothetical protein [Brevibacillus sp.]
MNITLNIEAGSPAELQEAIAGLAGIVGGVVAPQTTVTTEEPEKQKRSRKQEKQPASEPEKVEEKQDSSAADEADYAADDAPEYVPSVVELRAKAQEKGKTPEGKKAIKALLDEFGSKSISDVPEEKRAAFLAALGAL